MLLLKFSLADFSLIVVYSVNIRGPHKRLVCKDYYYIIYYYTFSDWLQYL